MGEDVWRSENEWPLARAVETDFFLSSGGNANSIAGDGALVDGSAGRRPAGRLPLRPVPPRADRRRAALLLPGDAGPRRLRPAPGRSAAPTSSSTRRRPWSEDTEVTGPVRLHLWAATTAPDTDFTGKLVDIYPDGYARNLTDGIIRARYRQGTDAAAADHARRGLRVHDRPLGDQQPLPPGPPHRPGGEQQQLPPLRPQPQHRPRARRRRGDAARPCRRSIHDARASVAAGAADRAAVGVGRSPRCCVALGCVSFPQNGAMNRASTKQSCRCAIQHARRSADRSRG